MVDEDVKHCGFELPAEAMDGQEQAGYGHIKVQERNLSEVLDAWNDDCHAGVVIEAVQQDGNNDTDTMLTEPSSQSSWQLILDP